MSYYRIDADSTLYLHYPGPVRRAYSTAVRERSALGRGKQLLTFAEQAVGWCASIAVSKYRNATSVNGVNRTVESSLAQLRERRGPAFGDYARLWREANAALIDTPECKHSWFSMDVAAAPGMSALARFANFLKEAEDSGPQTGQAVHDAATAIATATSTSGQVPLGEFVAALVWVRNKLEHPRISKSEDWESATPLLEAAVVELLCRTSVADVVQSHPVVTLKELRRDGYLVEGEDRGVYFLCFLPPDRCAEERWAGNGPPPETGSSLLLRTRTDNTLEVDGLFYELSTRAPRRLNAPDNAGALDFTKKSQKGAGRANVVFSDLIHAERDGRVLRVPLMTDVRARVVVSVRSASTSRVLLPPSVHPADERLETLLTDAVETAGLGPLDIEITSVCPTGRELVGAKVVAAVRALASAGAANQRAELQPSLTGKLTQVLARVGGYAHETWGEVDVSTGELVQRFSWLPSLRLVVVEPWVKTGLVTPTAATLAWRSREAELAELEAAVIDKNARAMLEVLMRRSKEMMSLPDLRDSFAHQVAARLVPSRRSAKFPPTLLTSGHAVGVLLENDEAVERGVVDKLGWIGKVRTLWTASQMAAE